MQKDYILPDGTVIEVNVKKEQIPDIDVTKMTEVDLARHCVELFSNFGWTVRTEEIVKLEKGNIRVDLVLGDGTKDYGFVEIVSKASANTLMKKKEFIECIIDSCKPDIFILTNGIVFDVFYKGEYAGTKEMPPTLEDTKRLNRLMAYAKAFNDMKREKNDE